MCSTSTRPGAASNAACAERAAAPAPAVASGAWSARALGATELLEIDLANLRHIVQTDTALSELFLRAFVLAART